VDKRLLVLWEIIGGSVTKCWSHLPQADLVLWEIIGGSVTKCWSHLPQADLVLWEIIGGSVTKCWSHLPQADLVLLILVELFTIRYYFNSLFIKLFFLIVPWVEIFIVNR
jgi:hypothetical protein